MWQSQTYTWKSLHVQKLSAFVSFLYCNTHILYTYILYLYIVYADKIWVCFANKYWFNQRHYYTSASEDSFHNGEIWTSYMYRMTHGQHTWICVPNWDTNDYWEYDDGSPTNIVVGSKSQVIIFNNFYLFQF